MFDFGISSGELLLIAIVALIVVGPKDLPQLLRTIGRMMTRMRGMAREFQSHIDEAMRETGVDDVKKEVAKMTDLRAGAPDLKKEADDVRKAIESSAPRPASGETPSNGAAPNGGADPEKEPAPAPALEAASPETAAPTVEEAAPPPEPVAAGKATGAAGS